MGLGQKDSAMLASRMRQKEKKLRALRASAKGGVTAMVAASVNEASAEEHEAERQRKKDQEREKRKQAHMKAVVSRFPILQLFPEEVPSLVLQVLYIL